MACNLLPFVQLENCASVLVKQAVGLLQLQLYYFWLLLLLVTLYLMCLPTTETFMVLPMLAWVALLFANLYNHQKLDRNAFVLTTITMILITGSIFVGMFPRV